MFGLEDKNKREAIEFVIKQIAMVISVIAILLFGTAYLGKIDQEQQLKAKLIGDTNITHLKYGPYKTTSKEKAYCFVEGSYQIKNIGKYPFVVKSVSISLWEIPYISDDMLDENNALSYSLSERLKSDSRFPAKKAGEAIEIEVGEQFGIANILQRSFGFIVPISEPEKIAEGVGSRYVVIANAIAELDDRAPWYSKITHFVAGDLGISFLPNDLQHMTGTLNICKTPKAEELMY